MVLIAEVTAKGMRFAGAALIDQHNIPISAGFVRLEKQNPRQRRTVWPPARKNGSGFVTVLVAGNSLPRITRPTGFLGSQVHQGAAERIGYDGKPGLNLGGHIRLGNMVGLL